MVAGVSRRSDDGSRLLRTQRRPAGRSLVRPDFIGSQRRGRAQVARARLCHASRARLPKWSPRAAALGHERRRSPDGLGRCRNSSHSCCAGVCCATSGQPNLDHQKCSTEEHVLGDRSSYTYQLAALAETLQSGAEFLIDVDDSVANAELIDEVYLSAGLSPRG
jgi:hypothetical protein